MKCKVCKSQRVKLMDEEFPIYKCINCSHEFSLIERDKQEKYQENYFNDKHKNWFKHPNVGLFEMIRTKINPNGSVVDIGCGDCAFLKYLQNKGFKGKIYGVDVVDNNVPGIDYIKGDFLTLKLKKRFDSIVSLVTIEHVEEPQIYIDKIKDIMKDDSIVVINTFDSNCLMFRIARFLNRIGIPFAYNRLYEKHHLNHFNKRSLRRLLEQNNFKIINTYTTNYPIQAVDVPGDKFIYKVATYLIFKLSDINNTQILQTIICKKK